MADELRAVLLAIIARAERIKLNQPKQIMSEQDNKQPDGHDDGAATRTRNVLNLSAAFKLGQWLPDEDLSHYSTHAELAAAATTAVGSLVTEANMRTVLRQVGLEGKFEQERGKAEKIRKAGARLLDMLKQLADMADGFNVSGVYFNEFPGNKKLLDEVAALIAELEGE